MKWVKLDSCPDARSSHTVTPIGDDNLCMLFGEHEPRVPIQAPNDVLIYNLKTHEWTKPSQSGDKPIQRFAHSASKLHSSILIFGGRTAVAEETATDDCYLFDVPTATWMRLTDSSPPPARNYHSSAAEGHNTAWVFGGCGVVDGKAARLADLWQYDAREGKWSQLPDNPDISGRGGPGFAHTPNALWVIGGFSGKEMGDVFKFDLTAGKWHSIPTASVGDNLSTTDNVRFTARSVLAVSSHTTCSTHHHHHHHHTDAASTGSVCGHNNHIMIFGGEIDPSDLGHAGAGQFTGDAMCLDTDKLCWHGLGIEGGGEVPCARGWMAAAGVEDGMIISGGLDVDNVRLDDMWKLVMH